MKSIPTPFLYAWRGLIGLLFGILLLIPLSTGAKTLLVTNLADDGPGALREVMRQAVDGDEIVLAEDLAGQTIVLTEPIVIDGGSSTTVAIRSTSDPLQPQISRRLLRLVWWPYRQSSARLGAMGTDGGLPPADINILGRATISGGRATHLFEIGADVTVTVEGLILTDGYHPTGSGGAMVNAGTLNVKNCWLKDNTAKMNGGALYNQRGALLTVDDSTLSNNRADLNGGGMANAGTLTVRRSTLFGNTAEEGGGLYTDGTATAAYLTASQNHARSFGGGLVVKTSAGSLQLLNSLVVGNTAPNTQGQEIYIIGGTYTGLGVNLLGQHNDASVNPPDGVGYEPNPKSRDQTLHALAPTMDAYPRCTLPRNSSALNIGDLRIAQNNGVIPADDKADVGAVQYEDYHQLTITKMGAGTVTSTPELLDCGTDCIGNFPGGTTVTLHATPATGSTFDGWGGACSGASAECPVTMSDDQTATATFSGGAATERFDPITAGTISWFYAAAFNRVPVPNSALANRGDIGGLAFWTQTYLAGDGVLAAYQGNVYAIADFFVASAEFQGRYPASLTDTQFVTALYQNMLGRDPDEGGLAYWVGRLATVSRGTVLADFTNSPENRNANALRKAALKSYIAFIDADADHAITEEEAGQWLTRNPTLDGRLLDTPPTTTYTVTVGKTGTGSGAVSSGGNYAEGAAVTLTANPTNGATFTGWSPSPCAASFTMPANNLTCTATFTAPICEEWYSANLTNYTSYPDPGSEECVQYNGCKWSGQFYGLDEKQSEEWVAAHNIIAVHEKDWDTLGLKMIKLRQGNKEIIATVYDLCSDSDCDGCCTRNLGPINADGNRYLIDIEKYTMERFGSGDGIVQFQICN